METNHRPTPRQLADAALDASFAQQVVDGPIAARDIVHMHEETDPNMFFVQAAETLGWDFDLTNDADEYHMNEAMATFDLVLAARGWKVAFGADFDVPYGIYSEMADLSDTRVGSPFRTPAFRTQLWPGVAAQVTVAVNHPDKACRRELTETGVRYLVLIEVPAPIPDGCAGGFWQDELPPSWIGRRTFATDDPEEAMALVRMARAEAGAALKRWVES